MKLRGSRQKIFGKQIKFMEAIKLIRVRGNKTTGNDICI